jgi:hypothetical protein
VVLREAGAWVDPNGAEAATSSFVSRAKGAAATSSSSATSHGDAAKKVADDTPAKTTAVKPATTPEAAKPADGKTAAAAKPATAKNAAPVAKTEPASKTPAKPAADATKPAANTAADASKPGATTAAATRGTESSAVQRIRASVANAKVQTATPIEEHIQYQYNTLGRRDPFEAMVGNFVGDDVGGDAPVDVGGVKVVGIVWGADSFALVEDGRGNSLILRRGDKVMNGFVEDLKRDAVVVRLNMDGLTQSVAIPLTRKGEQSNGTR